jgi:predicted acyltransferase
LTKRYYSLDVFRGATVALMILVNNPGSGHVFEPLEHAPWHGCTPTDLVFPFFLFAVGNALSFVMPRLQAEGPSIFWRKVISRSLLIYLIGLFLTWYPFVRWTDTGLQFKHWVEPSNPDNGIRILGVLARIALCYFFASILIYFFKPRGAFVAGAIFLLLYWLLCFLFGQPGDLYSMQGWFGNAIDKKFLGIPHMYKGEGVPFDPEGIMSTLPAITEVIFGYLVGDYLQKKGKTFEMLTGLFIAGVTLVLIGYCWDMVFPINKKIWTSSFTVYTSGLATIILAMLIYLIEFKEKRGWLTSFFNVFGKNALFVFSLSALLPKTLWMIRWTDHLDNEGHAVITNPWNWFYEHICAKVPGIPENGSLVFALCVVSLFWFVCYLLDKKKIYIRV